MSITNHGAVGALIAIVIKQPVLMLPLAFLSHFVLDAMPHFGFNRQGYGEIAKHKVTFIEEAFNIPAFLVLLVLLQPFGWWVYLGGFMAILPDTTHPIRYFFYERKGLSPHPNGPITKFHKQIQWMERPWGVLVEVPLSIILLTWIYLLRP